MKTSKFKSWVAALIIVTMSFSSTTIKAEEVVLPIVTAPSVLQEGTQRELTSAQIAELLPWAKNSKIFLNDLLDSLQGLSSVDKLSRLVDGIKSAVGESAPKNSELLMRYVLNRGIVVNDILSKEMSEENVGSIDVKLRVLVSSIKIAVKYYDADMDTLTKKTAAPFAAFAIDYHDFLTELNKSIFDATAQYHIQRIALEWLQWDLYRDLNNTSYASQIVKINNALKIYPAVIKSDKTAIATIKQMKLVAQQLDLRLVRKNKPNKNNQNQNQAPVTYSTEYAAGSNGYCYRVDEDGGLVTASTVSNSKCIESYKAHSNGYCYGVDANGEMLTSSTVSNSNCLESYRAHENGYCYGVDSYGEMLTSATVNNSNCTESYKAHSNGYCYARDVEGTLLTSATVSNANCTETYERHSNGYCYAADIDGTLLTSQTVKASYCSN